MFQILVSHNDDIKRLVEKGYAVGFDSNCLIVRDVPYLDAEGQLQTGAIVAKLVFVDENRVIQDDHQVYFAGSHPHGLDGKPVANLAGGPHQLQLSEASADVVVQRSFSNKPRATGAFANFFDKIESYVAILSGPAIDLHGASPYTFRTVEAIPPESVFKFSDTLTSRAEITALSQRFRDDVIAIIGLGGTGAYLLDFVAKTPVKEIRLFDLDLFYVHNAFRSPGKLDAEELGKPKADIYQARYDGFRNGVKADRKFVDASCSEDLDGVTFAFVCVDKGSSRAGIFDLLLEKGIPFIDVGMGLHRKNDSLNGMLRSTYYSAEDGERIRSMALSPLSDKPDDVYRVNIQISELNALNAALAVIKFKQVRGFYTENAPYYHHLFDVGDLKGVGMQQSDEN